MISDKAKRDQFILELAQAVAELGMFSGSFTNFYFQFEAVLTPAEQESTKRFMGAISEAIGQAGKLLASVKGQTDTPPDQN